MQRDQGAILQRVSRTFALTIPLLPEPLRCVVTTAYLLCRITDTIEDESALAVEQKEHFHAMFMRCVRGDADADDFAAQLVPLLTCDTTEAEKDLIGHSAEIIDTTHTFNDVQRRALERCLSVMCEGMPRYERSASVDGLPDQRSLDQYCYYVAGVVGETLTMLFCDHCADIADNREQMMRLGVSFGEGLQMVNILKDFWEDRARGVCWLPQSIFMRAGVDLGAMTDDSDQPGFGEAYASLIAIAHGHLRNGFEYTLLIPDSQTGIRRFCLLALGLAVQTLHRIQQRPEFRCGSEVKVSHAVVANTLIMTRLLAGYDRPLRRWFAHLVKELPMEADYERVRLRRDAY